MTDGVRKLDDGTRNEPTRRGHNGDNNRSGNFTRQEKYTFSS